MAAPGTTSTESARHKIGGGPHGVGDPNDLSLRKVEVEVLIPKIMRERAKAEKCVPEVKAFTDCCSGSSIAMVLKCRQENSALRDCLTRWYKDEQFKSECKNQYLQERSDFRRTGLQKKHRDFLKEHQKSG